MSNDLNSKLRSALSRALGEIERLRTKLASLEESAAEPVAIVGVGLRLPGGVQDLSGLWRLLEGGSCTVGPIPPERWDVDGTGYVREAAFLDSVDEFDASFFGIGALEAQAMDPQQRLLLETAWEALETAAIVPASLVGSKTGVFVGTTTHDYEHLQLLATANTYSSIGTHPPFAAGRLAFHLGLRGPTLAVDTACSSSLVALHVACQSLRSRESDLALVGGVQLMLSPNAFTLMSLTNALAPDGRSKTFSANADGYGRGEGAIVLVCERLEDARARQREILAVVRGSAVNHDGASNGITAPSGAAQVEVIRAALAEGKLGARDVDFVECHGTGTRLGDPIEVHSLAEVYCAGRSIEDPLLIGAIKPNVGHLESAAGLAGVVKLLAAFRHARLPPTILSSPRNPFIEWDELAVRVVDTSTAWPRVEGRPSRAAVSSFGISGTNAHVVLEAATEGERPVEAVSSGATEDGGSPSCWPITLSGRTRGALADQARRLLALLEAEPEVPLFDLGFSLATTRTHFEQRACVVASDRKQLRAGLEALAAEVPEPSYVQARAGVEGKLVFVYPGQGSQWAAMAKLLREQSPAFRQAIEACADALEPHTDWSLLTVLRGEPNAASLERVDVVQPVLFAMMVGLTAVWRALGVVPDAVVGHSQGEIAAAHVAGILSLEDAAKIVALRSRVIAQQLGSGAMAAVSLSAEALVPRLAGYGDRLSLAVDNGPTSTAVSGDVEAIDELVRALEADGVFARKIRVTYASHCAHIEGIREPLLEALAGLRPRPAELPMFSTVELAPLAGPELDGEYWYRNLRQPVRFAGAVEALVERGHRFFVEVSAHPVLPVALAGIFEAGGVEAAVVGSLRRDEGSLQRAMLSLGELHCQGRSPDWSTLFGPCERRPVPLPTYAFQRQRHWVEVQPVAAAGTASARGEAEGGHPLLGLRFVMSTPAGTSYWERSLSATAPAWLGDHRVEEACLFPGAGFAEASLAAARELAGTDAIVIDELELRRALILREGSSATMQVALTEADGSAWRVAIAEAAGEDWLPLASAKASLALEALASTGPTLAELQARCSSERQPSELYAFAAANGLNYGPAFQGLEALWLDPEGEWALARIHLPESAGAGEGFVVHPALLDACFHVPIAPLLAGEINLGPAVPVLLEGLRLRGPVGAGPIWCAATAPCSVDDSGRTVTSLTLWDGEGELLGRIEALHAEPLAGAGSAVERSLLELDWRPLEQPPAVDAAAAAGARWLVLGDRGEVGERLRALLEARGAQARLERVDPLDRAAIDRLLDELCASDEPFAGVVCLWSLDAPELRQLEVDGVLDALRPAWAGLLNLVQGLASRTTTPADRLVIVTERAQSLSSSTVVRPEQTLVWGLGGTIRSEHGALRPLLVDLDDRDRLEELATVVLTDLEDDQLALREGVAHVARIQRGSFPAAIRYRSEPASGSPYRLELETPGSLDSLHLVGFERKEPGPKQVELAVEAAGINFRDVLLATGVVPPIGDDDRVRLGFECAGTITRVGAKVEGLEVGQRVIALTADGFATHTLADAELVFPVPDALSCADAATLPIVHISAYYGLHHVARLRAGERVLIHSATGGVGLAASQWARHVGAEIYATAGTEAKREWLREQGLAHVSDSRSSRFVEDVRRWTRGEGVDVVLNALSGELMRKSLGLLRHGGRFIDLGLSEALANAPLGMGPFARGLGYTLVNVGEMARHAPDRLREVFTEILEHVRAERLRPLPREQAPLSKAVDVFWEMGRARHIGKFVLTTAEPEPPTIEVPVAADRSPVSGAGSYLITGGLGGLGLVLARWLAEQGAGHLILLSRRGVTRDEQREAIAAIEAAGARVSALAADAADFAALEAIVAELPAEQPLRGVVHAAGLLDDAMLINQSVDKFERVLAPKVAGAWNLHRLTQELELDFFVLYSSAASLFGSAGQGNYVAANAFLDGLARHRRSLGLPALSLSWGAFADVGLAAVEDIRGARLSNRGVISLTPEDGLELFARLVGSSLTHVAPCPLDIAQWVEFNPDAERWPYFSELLAEAPQSGSERGSSLLDSLKSASPKVGYELLLALVIEELARVIREDPESLDPETPFAERGVDSLMGVELRNRLKSATGVELPSTAIWTYPTPAKLAAHLASSLVPTQGLEEPESDASAPGEDAIMGLDDEDVEAMLLAELEGD